MGNLSLKQKIIGIIIAIGLLLIAIFKMGLYGPGLPQSAIRSTETKNSQTTQNSTIDPNAPPTIVSTNPSPLENSILLPNQAISLTFNRPYENGPDLKISTDPPVDLKLEETSDKKTITITPKKAYALGQGYTLVIKPEAKFQGGKTLEHEQRYFFRTIAYQGI